MAAALPPSIGNLPAQQGGAIQSGASLSDLLTAAKNLVTAFNGLTQAYLNVNGQTTATTITFPTIIKASAGRVVNVTVSLAGSAPGQIYDTNTLTATRQLYIIPTTVGLFNVNLPTSFGILVLPGTGQQVAVSYS